MSEAKQIEFTSMEAHTILAVFDTVLKEFGPPPEDDAVARAFFSVVKKLDEAFEVGIADAALNQR